jgi:hypothetical protein
VTCFWCGDEHRVELLEYWVDSHAFMLDTCCEGAHHDAVAWLEEEPEAARAWLAEQGCPVRRVAHWGVEGGAVGCAGVGLDFGLHLGPIAQADARAFVAKHHRHVGADGTHRPPRGWKWGHAVYNGATLVGVAFVGRPVARMLQQKHPDWVEITRVCVSQDLPSELGWNACSMLYGAACRRARDEGMSEVITYTLLAEEGASLRAAGFVPIYRSRGGSWDRPSRARKARGPQGGKLRWHRGLTKAACRRVARHALVPHKLATV